MTDDSRIKNNQAPYQEYKTEQNDDVDPEKFKKIMKVDKSEDSQKKRKRALKEEDEEEDEVDGTSTAPQEGLFASFMNEDKSSSVFDKQSAGVKNIEVSEGGPATELADDDPQVSTSSSNEQAPPPPSITTNDLDQNESSSSGANMGDEMDFSSLESMDEINYNPEPPASESPTSSDQPLTQQEADKTDKNKTDEPQEAKPDVRITKKKSVKSAEQAQPKKKVTKKIAGQKTDVASKKPAQKGVVQEALQEAKPASEMSTAEKADAKEKASPHFTMATPEKVADTLLSAHEGSDHDREGSDKEKHKKHELPSDKIVPLFPHANVDNAGIPAPTDIQTAPPAATPSPVAAMTKLSPEVYELFEKMAGVITIESGHDMTTTSVVVNMEGSVFHGAEVVLNQYKSAQGSYNLELKGSPAAVELFTENLPMLEAAFKQGSFNFDVNILPPSLSKKSGSKRVKRKSHDGKRDKR